MLVSLDKVNKMFGDKTVLDNVSVTIEDKDRIGLVGANGIGKSTLLNVITGKLFCDGGSVYTKDGITIGFLEQNSGLDSNNTIYEEMLSVFKETLDLKDKIERLSLELEQSTLQDKNYDKISEEYSSLLAYFESIGGYEIDVKIKTVLNGMGFSDKSYDFGVHNLSGGEKTRLALAKLLLSDPQLLILDEPTNHLDFKTLSWLEDYLQSYKGSILTVSHDRYFLDKIVSKMWDIEDKTVVAYPGNYTKYKELKRQRIAALTKAAETQQEKINQMEEFVARNIVRASTSNRAKSRLHQLEHIERIKVPTSYDKPPSFRFDFARNPVKDVLFVKDLTLTVLNEDKVLCDNVSFEIKRGDKAVIFGPNGIGKSTLLKTILKGSTKGDIRLGEKVSIGYYDQENRNLDPEMSSLEQLFDRFPLMKQYELRSVLGQVLIKGDEVFKPIKNLSGGQRARLALAILMLQKNNLLILDEPTNHLDLESKEALEDALKSFEGTIIFVSHDRYFLNNIPNKIIELSKSGVTLYNGNFDYYMQQQLKIEQEEKTDKAVKKPLPDNSYYRSKKQRALEASRKAHIKELEAKLELLEKEIDTIQKELELPEVSSDYAKLSELCEKLENTKKEHDALFEEWANM